MVEAKRRRKVTEIKRAEETLKEIMSLRDSGMKVAEIAAHFGVSKERIYQIAGEELKAWQAEHAPPPKPKPKKRMDVRSIRQMIAEGKSMTEIGRHYGVTRQAVYERLKKDDEAKGRMPPPVDLRQYKDTAIDPETGYAITVNGTQKSIVGRMGDERVTAFVRYHMDMLAMRQGCDKRDVQDLYQRFYRYLGYCAEHGIVPNNMNAYFAIGLSPQDVPAWRRGVGGSPEHRAFAETLSGFFASVHEQGATDGVLNPISSIFWQKAHDGLVEASKLEVVQEDPLGDRKSAEEIAKKYTELPD